MNNDTHEDVTNKELQNQSLGSISNELSVTDVSEEVLDVLPSTVVHGDVEEINE